MPAEPSDLSRPMARPAALRRAEGARNNSDASIRGRSRRPWSRIALVSLVAAYLILVLGGPLIALAHELIDIGGSAILEALQSPPLRLALMTSIELTLWAVLLNALFGTAGALALSRWRMPGSGLLDALADLPLAVSPVMAGLALMLVFGRRGWMGPLLDLLQLKVTFAFGGLLLATLFVTLPFTIREIVYVLDEVGTSEEEAATTLGASPWQTFWRVTLPNIRYGLGYGLLMTAARSLGEFGAVLVIGGSIAGHTQTATTLIHDALEERDRAAAYGMALLLALASVSLLLLLERAKQRLARRQR